MIKNIEVSLVNATKSLDGLSVGDAFGELFFRFSPFYTKFEDLPTASWKWTDDTHMALSIVEILKKHQRIDQDELAKAFAKRYVADPRRGYAGGAHHLLGEVAQGANWREIHQNYLEMVPMETAGQCALLRLVAFSMMI